VSISRRDKVFVSYSHKDEKWFGELKTMLDPAIRNGVVDLWDDTRILPGDAWKTKIAEALAAAKVGVLLVSSNFLASDFIANNELPPLLEAAQCGGARIFWVLLSACQYDKSAIANYQAAYDLEKPLRELRPPQREAAWKKIATRLLELAEDPSFGAKPTGQPMIAPSRLHVVGRVFKGRRRELDVLDRAWASGDARGPKPKTNIFSLVAQGGAGKTALVLNWCAHLAANGWRQAERVFDWSFSIPGTGDQRAARSGPFFDAAFQWFGELQPGSLKGRTKGQRLAALVDGSRTLLILDGLEAFQYPPGSSTGYLTDEALIGLLVELARQNSGLCLVTTRVAVADLTPYEGHTATRRELRQLGPDAGLSLLRALGVTGPDTELRRVVTRELRGHALALNLLGNYLRCATPDHNIRRWRDVPLLREDEEEGGHARRVLRAYENWLGPASRELAVLRLLGLFDRPADAPCTDALCRAPVIHGLTDNLVKASSEEWNRILNRLEEGLGLITRGGRPAGGTHPPSVDCHPLLREYFGNELQEKNPRAWREGHRRLCRHLEGEAQRFPVTLTEMEPLYRAAWHGCQAGEYRRVLRQILQCRLRRDSPERAIPRSGYRRHFSFYAGGVRSDLEAFSQFFRAPFNADTIVGKLDPASKAWLLNETGSALRAVGRVHDSLPVISAAVACYKALDELHLASRAASNLALAHLLTATPNKSLRAANEAVRLADRSKDQFEQMASRSYLGRVLHQSGRLSESLRMFIRACAYRKKADPARPFLVGFQGLLFAELLFDTGDNIKLFKYINLIECNLLPDWVRDKGLYHLLLARRHDWGGESAAADGEYGHAVAYLEQAGHQAELARAYSLYGRFLLGQGSPTRAEQFLTKANRVLESTDLELARFELELFRFCDIFGASHGKDWILISNDFDKYIDNINQCGLMILGAECLVEAARTGLKQRGMVGEKCRAYLDSAQRSAAGTGFRRLLTKIEEIRNEIRLYQK
jgi:tetratricopeptide (TPR) repeat protein